MESNAGFALHRLWTDSESAITQKTTHSHQARNNDIRRAISVVATLPTLILPDSATQRAIEKWERNIWESKVVAILSRIQEGKAALIKKDGGKMFIAIVLDKPLAEAQAIISFSELHPGHFPICGCLGFLLWVLVWLIYFLFVVCVCCFCFWLFSVSLLIFNYMYLCYCGIVTATDYIQVPF